MLLQLLRGHVEDMSSTAKDGEVECKIGSHNIKLHKHLITYVGKGNDVLLACTQRNGSYHAWAVKNIDTGKSAQIDPINTVMGVLASGVALIFGLALGTDAEASGAAVWVADVGLAFIGAAGIAICLQRLFLITRASNWIRYADC